MNQPIRVGLVDDHPAIRGEIRILLRKAQEIIVIGEGSDGSEAIQLAEQHKPDLLLLDVELPKLSGDKVVQKLQGNLPEVKVLAVSAYEDSGYIMGMLENGAAGYITKDEVPGMLLVAVRSISQEHIKWISPKAARHIKRIMLGDKVFTGRELAVLIYFTLGESDLEVAKALEIDTKIVQQVIENLLQKFDVPTRQGLKKAARAILSTTHS